MTPRIPPTSARNDVILDRERINQRYALARTVVRTAGVVAAVYFVSQQIASLAGEQTMVAIELAILGDFKFVASITLAGAAAVWAIVERRLRYRKVEYMQGRIRELEQKIDPRRSSSGLTLKGTTNPRDMT